MIFAAMAAAAMLLAETTPAGSPAAAPAPAAKPATEAAPAKPGTLETDKVICKNEAVLGSRMTKKVCYSAKDRVIQQQEERLNLDRIQKLGAPN